MNRHREIYERKGYVYFLLFLFTIIMVFLFLPGIIKNYCSDEQKNARVEISKKPDTFPFQEACFTPSEGCYAASLYDDDISSIALLLGLMIGNFSLSRLFASITKRKMEKQKTGEGKKTYEELFSNEHRYKFIAESISDTITILDMNFKCRYVNPAIFKQRGYTVEERLSQSLDQILTPSSLAEAKRIFEEELRVEGSGKADPKRNRLMVLDHYHKNGSIINAEVNFSFIRDEKGTPVAIITASRDISEWKNSENALVKNNELYEELFEEAPICYHEIDSSGNIVKVNATELNLLGYTLEEMLNKPVWSFIENPEESKTTTLKKLSGELTPDESFERNFVKKDGAVITLLIKDKCLISADGKISGMRASLQDITQRKKSEEDLKQQLIYTEAASKIANSIIENESQEILLNDLTKIIGETLHLDRCLIYDVAFERAALTGLTEWLNKNCENLEPTKATYSIKLFGEPLYRMKKSRQYLLSYFDDINEFFLKDGSGKILHEEMEIKSGFWLPFSFYDNGYFLLVLNQVSHKRRWTKEEIEFISHAGKQIEIALAKIKIVKDNQFYQSSLIESERRNLNLLSILPDLLFTVSRNYIFTDCQVNNEDTLLMPKSEFIGKHVDDILPDELAALTKKYVDLTLTTGASQNYEYSVNIHGRIKWEDIRMIKSGEDEVLAIVRDITDRKRAEYKLRESEARFRLITENLSEGILYFNNGRIEYVSPSFCSIFNVTETEQLHLGEKEIAERIHPDDIENTFKTVYSAIAEKKLTAKYVYRFKTKTGGFFWREDHARFIYDDNLNHTGSYVICRDVTDHVLAESRLHESEERFRLIAENLSDGIIYFKKDRVEYISPSYTKLFGYSNLTDIQDAEKEIFELIHPEDKEKTKVTVYSAIANKKESASYAFRFKCKSGDYVWREDHARFIYDEAQNFLGAYVICRDITERKLAELRLRESDERFRSFFNSSLIGAAITDVDGKWLYFNDELCRMLGYSGSELEKLSWQQLIPSKDLEKESIYYKEIMDGKIPSDIEKRIIKRDGSVIDVLVSSAAVRNNNNSIAYFTFVIQDITERKRAIIKLEESEKKFRNIFLNSSAVMLLIDPKNGYIVDANPSAEQFYGYSLDKLCSMSIEEINMLPSEEIFKKMSETIRNRRNYFVCPHKISSGEYLTVEVYSSIIIQNDNTLLFSIIHDITERQRVELELQRSESKLKTIFSSLPDIILILDGEGRYLEIPPTNPKLLYKPSKELVGRRFSEIFPNEIAADYLNPIRQALQLNEPIYYDYGMIIDSKKYWFSAIITRYQSNSVIWVARDITEKKSAETQIQKLSKGIEQSPTTVVITDTEGTIEYVNPKFTELTGYTSEEAIGQNPRILKAEGLRPEEYENMWKTIKSGYDWHGEFMNKKRSGEIFYESASISPIKDEHGRITNFIAIKEDVTRRKEAESALLSYSLRFVTILDHFPSGVLLEDSEKKAILYNDKFSKIFNFPFQGSISQLEISKNVMIKNKNLFINEDYFEERIFNITSESKKVFSEEFEMINGSFIKLDYIPIMQDVNGIMNHVWIVNDITEDKRAEEIKQKTDFQLQRAQKLESLGVLAGGIAHDFNNLLGAIYGYIELAADESSEPMVSNFLKKAQSSMDRAKALTYQLLTFSKGGTPITKTAALFPFVKDTASFILSGSNISCKFDIADNLYKCSYDRNQIGQVIDNLVINAKQAMPNGGEINISAKNYEVISDEKQEALTKGSYVSLSIADTGIGISKDILNKIFDPFFTTKDTGNGLGLATCYSIIKNHKGTIEIESKLGIGSTFIIYLPAAKEIEKGVLSEKTITKHLGAGKILIMDDEKVILDLMGEILQGMGYTAVFANKGEDALESFIESVKSGERFKAIILDITVRGGMGGKETAFEIRKLDMNIPIFVSSGYAEDPILADPQKYGFTDSLRKPVKISEIYDAFNKYLV